MKFIVNTDLLLNKLQVVGGTIVSKPVIPILDHFLFDINDGKLKVTATDLETSMSTTLDVQADESITIAVPSKLCMDTLRSLPNQPVTFSINKDNLSIEIKSEFGRYKLVGQNGDDFPKIPEVDNGNAFDLESGILSSCNLQDIICNRN